MMLRVKRNTNGDMSTCAIGFTILLIVTIGILTMAIKKGMVWLRGEIHDKTA